MSVTFWCPDAPRVLETCCLCDGSGKDWQCPELPCYCAGGPNPGQELVSVAPNLNVSQDNAYWLIQVAGLEWDQCGTIGLDQISAISRALLRARNVDRVVQDACHPASLEVGRLGARVHTFETVPEHVLYRIDRLQELLAYAAKHKLTITWG